MTVGGNYFLIGAYVVNMTDKLTIVKESGRVCCFVFMSVRMQMFPPRSRSSLETKTRAKIMPSLKKNIPSCVNPGQLISHMIFDSDQSLYFIYLFF